MEHLLNNILEQFQIPLKNPVFIFSIILFIILLSPIILKRLNIPGIIGLIISGLIVGPHGLNLIAKTSAIELFSTIGLLYIMFIAGLELDMNEFKVHRNKSLIFGLLTFTVPLLLGFPIMFFIFQYNFNASLLVASMFATHTLVSYPIVSKLGISKNHAVAVTVGGTIITDTAVLIILAIIKTNHYSELDNSFWLMLFFSMLIFGLFLFVVIPRIAKWFFERLESEKHSHYIFVLSVVFLAAFLAELAGLEPIIGSFAAGLALNRLIPHSSALMNRIEFIGNSLFIPFFLISVGMILDLSNLFNHPMSIIIAITLTTFSLFSKYIAALFTQLIFRFNKAQGLLIFGLSSSHAAATLAIILVGYNSGILDDKILNGTILLILVTCLFSTIMTEKAAKQIIVNHNNEESKPLNYNVVNNEHILVPIANYSNVDKLLDFAVLIKDKKSVNPISLLTVVPNNDEAEINIVKSRNKLESFVKHASSYEVKANVLTTIDHNSASGISRTSREIMADIILIGWPQHRDLLVNKILGEKIDKIINKVEKTLFICQITKPLITSKRILLFSPPLSEKEFGFNIWFPKVLKLSNELTLPIVIFANSKTKAELIEYQQKFNTSIYTFIDFNKWEDFFSVKEQINNDDIIILANSRLGQISYQKELENLPTKIEKNFQENSKMIIYPQINELWSTENYEELNSNELVKSIETIGKGIESIFKRTK